MNKTLIIIIVLVIILSLILYKSISVFEKIINDAKTNPKKFEQFLNPKQKELFKTLNELEEELSEKEEELAKHLQEEEKKTHSEGEHAESEHKTHSEGEHAETEHKTHSEGEHAETEHEMSMEEEENNVESFTNQNMTCPQAIFSSPCAVNTPINEEAIPEVYTGGNYNSYKPLNPTTGNYCFPIQKFQYDGIWNNDVVQLGNGYQTNNWSMPKNQPIIQSQYCTNKFIDIPENVLIPGTKIHSETVNETNYVMQCC